MKTRQALLCAALLCALCLSLLACKRRPPAPQPVLSAHPQRTFTGYSAMILWRVGDGRRVHTLTEGLEHVYSVAFSPDGRWLATGGREKGAVGTLWKQVTGNRLRGGQNPTVRLWQVRDGALQQALAGHSDDVYTVAFSPDGKWLASAGDDRTVILWRLDSKTS